MNLPRTRLGFAAMTLAALMVSALTGPAFAADEQTPTLAPGTYPCVSGMNGQPTALGVILAGDHTYTDLHGGNSGTYVVDGTGVTYSDGAMDGYVGEIVGPNTFKVGLMATCTLKTE